MKKSLLALVPFCVTTLHGCAATNQLPTATGCSVEECAAARLNLERKCRIAPDKFGYPVDWRDYHLLIQNARVSPTPITYCQRIAAKIFP